MIHLEAEFQSILDKGGEGIILRDPNETYTPGRSPGFLKHKVCNISDERYPSHPYQKYRDAEAKIVGPVSLHRWECEL